MHPTPPVRSVDADAQARYNRRWSGRLLLLNAVLLCWLTMGDSLHEYFGPYAFWMLPTLPAVLTALAGLVAASLPKPLQGPFHALLILGVLMTIAVGLLAFWESSLGR